MRLIISGGRHLEDVALIRRALMRFHTVQPLTVLIHGGNAVLGTTVEDWARDHCLHVVRYPANWRKFGKRAETIRNAFMLQDSRPNFVLALPGGMGTRDLVCRAFGAGIPVFDAQGSRLEPAGHPDNAEPPPPEPLRSAHRAQMNTLA